jgi:hypothetical protein
MVEKRTVFILGAGASCPYGFPTARELRSDIIDHFQARYEKLFADREKLGIPGVNDEYPPVRVAADFVRRFDQSSTESIDLFLSRHPALWRIGKMAICLSILFKEQASHFRERVKDRSNDWYFYLFNKLSRDLIDKGSLLGFGKSGVAFVTFNYDRSLEHFLFDSLLNSFEDADGPGVRQQISEIPIIHIYGKLAPLQWQDASMLNVLEYGKYDMLPQVNLSAVSNNLHVIHEERKDPALEEAREQISKAERLFFLGFGYAKENLEALGIPRALKAEHYIRGTAMGATRGEIDGIENRLLGTGHIQQKILDCDCLHLLRECL